jgi:glutathione S-transferase
MEQVILHYYEGSPYAQKVRLLLGFKQARWRSVVIPVVMPRPELTALTAGYRRTPVLQVGADVYCDTRRIADCLEQSFPEPTLHPAGSRGLSELMSRWVEPRVFVTTSLMRFQEAEDVAGIFHGRVDVASFAADRAPLWPARSTCRGSAT